MPPRLAEQCGPSLAPRCDEPSSCPVCDSTTTAASFSFQDYLHGVPGTFTYVQCAGCSTVYQNPRVRLEDLGLCYPAAYMTHSAPAKTQGATITPVESTRGQLRHAVLHYADGEPVTGLSLSIRLLGWLLAKVPALRRRARFELPDCLARMGPSGSRCLEVGPGSGAQLANLARIGWHAIGLDIDPAAAAIARRVSGCDVRVGMLTSVDFPPEHFHLIYMSHVIEHLPDLAASLRRCLKLLIPGGRLVLYYPNVESLAVRWYREFAPTWDPPRHLVLPPRSALVELLHRVGFVRIQASTTARHADWFRAVARQYRDGPRGDGFHLTASLGDRAFRLLESTLVRLGWGLGEEILVQAHKRPR